MVASAPRSGAWLFRSSPKPSIPIAGFTERLINGIVPPLVCLVNCRFVSNKRTGVLLWRRMSVKNSQTGLFEYWKVMWLLQARLLQSLSESPAYLCWVITVFRCKTNIDGTHPFSLVLNISTQDGGTQTGAFTVVSLEESLLLTAEGRLPDRAVVLTFDDGTYDFYKIVWPILKKFSYPVTLYLTTYYVEVPYPSPRKIWSYMLWRTDISSVNAHEILGKDVIFNLKDKSGREEAFRKVVSFADSEKMDGHHRNALSAKLAQLLGIDFDALCRSRICQLLRPEEVHELARTGVSVQMHMHHHRSPATHEAFIDNLRANRQFITQMTGSEPSHFCYPSGYYNQESVRWLRD